jgi:hypothetical protein
MFTPTEQKCRNMTVLDLWNEEFADHGRTMTTDEAKERAEFWKQAGEFYIQRGRQFKATGAGLLAMLKTGAKRQAAIARAAAMISPKKPTAKVLPFGPENDPPGAA